jgi:branched-chain amino acid transport system permease protein
VVNPELLAWHNSGEVLLMIILGGLGHLRGAVIGAVAFTLLKEFSTHRGLFGAARRPLAADAGPAIIVFVALLPQGPDRPGARFKRLTGVAGALNNPLTPLLAGTAR